VFPDQLKQAQVVALHKKNNALRRNCLPFASSLPVLYVVCVALVLVLCVVSQVVFITTKYSKMYHLPFAGLLFFQINQMPKHNEK
jgi:high-affinity K+ transport system ATPase subunit B